MRFLILLVIALIVVERGVALPLRYKNGTLKLRVLVIESAMAGSYYDDAKEVTYLGMIKSSFTPFIAYGSLAKRVNDYEKDFTCTAIKWGRRHAKATGSITLRGSAEKAEIKGTCREEVLVEINFAATGKLSKTRYYRPVQAGLRAKDLLDQHSEKFAPAEVINYALTDQTYFFDDGCKHFNHFNTAYKANPGVILLAKDFTHCAIFDNEGSKFIHSNPKSRKVTYESITMLKTYFPNGFIYKQIPDY